MSQNPISKLEQKYPIDFLRKITYEIKEGKIFLTSNNLFHQYSRNFNLDQIDPDYATGKDAYDNWENLFWFFLILNFIYLPIRIYFSVKFPVTLSFLFLALVFLSLKFVKYDYVYFRHVNGYHALGIRLSKSGKEKAFIDTLISEIQKRKKSSL